MYKAFYNITTTTTNSSNSPHSNHSASTLSVPLILTFSFPNNCGILSLY